MRVVLLVLSLVGLCSGSAYNDAIWNGKSVWPLPQSYGHGKQAVKVSNDLEFVAISHDSPLLQRAFTRYRNLIFPYTLPETDGSASGALQPGPAELSFVHVDVHTKNEVLNLGHDETYSIHIPSDGRTIDIAANSVYGAMYALETLSQLISIHGDGGHYEVTNAPVLISDRPQFPHRGLLLDTSRAFYPVNSIETLLDGMSYNKLNVFHWHLTDSQSFPVHSNRFPMLSAMGAYSKHEVYSHQDIKHIVQYAKDRGIRVIPELDMPGHTTSWGLAFPEITVCDKATPYADFCAEPPCGQLNPIADKTYEVVHGLIAELAQVFEDDMFHLGTDEVDKQCWEGEESISNHMKEHNLTTTDLLQHFITRAHRSVNLAGKTPINWEEVVMDFDLDLDNDTIVQVWKGVDSVKPVLSKGLRVISSPYTSWYLDCGSGNWITGKISWCDPYKTWQDMYAYQPMQDIDAEFMQQVLGGEAAIWSEEIDPANLEQKTWPRASAVAEKLWSNPVLTDDVDAALPRLLNHRELMVQRGISATPLQPKYCRMNPGVCNEPSARRRR